MKLSLWPFCGKILGPSKAILARFDLQKTRRADVLPAGPGGSTLIKILENEYGGTSISP